MKLIFLDEEYLCEKAEKGKDYIALYDTDNNRTVRFRGISDFSDYRLEGGEFEDV